MSPAPRRSAAAERTAAAREAAAGASGRPSAARSARPSAADRRPPHHWPTPAPPGPPELLAHGAHEQEEPEREEEEDEDEGQVILVAARAPGGALLEFLGVAREHLDDVVGAALHAAGDVIGAKARENCVLDDQARDRVGQHAFEAIPDLDAHLALVGCDDQQRAVVRTLLADAPMAAELVAVVRDVVVLQR